MYKFKEPAPLHCVLHPAVYNLQENWILWAILLALDLPPYPFWVKFLFWNPNYALALFEPNPAEKFSLKDVFLDWHYDLNFSFRWHGPHPWIRLLLSFTSTFFVLVNQWGKGSLNLSRIPFLLPFGQDGRMKVGLLIREWQLSQYFGMSTSIKI